MTPEEVLSAIAECSHEDAPRILKMLSQRIGGTSRVRELLLSLEGFGEPTEEDWAFLTFTEMLKEEERVGGFQWIIPNVLPEGGLVYFSAPAGGGKTWALLELVRAMTTGTKWLNHFDVPRSPVIYVDEEMGVRKIMPRFRKLGIEPDDAMFAYTNKAGVRLDLPADILKIRDRAVSMGAKVVIVDTLTRVHRMDENDNSQMKRLFSSFGPIMDAGVTLVILHHDKKGGVINGQVAHERMRGASEIPAQADMSFSVDKHGSYFRIETSKGRLNAEQDYITVDFAVTDNEERTKTTVAVISSEEKSTRVLTGMSARIEKALTERGPLSQADLAEAVEGKKAVVIEAASRMVFDKQILSSRDGRRVMYRMPTVADL